MSDYWVTFRIASNATYQKRYDALVAAAIEARGAGAAWADPTSFWLIQSALDISAFVKKLTAGLDAKEDLVVVRKVSANDSAYFGSIKALDVLKTFLPDIKKVG